MISVVIPTYNGSGTVSRAIQSVLNQTTSNFELIVVDDASTDNTGEVIDSFDDKRIKHLQHKENSGAPAKPKNTGIKEAQGKYIAFLDHDDEWRPKKLEKQAKLLESRSSKLGVVACNVFDVYENKQKRVKYKINKNVCRNPLLEILDKSFIHSSSSAMVKAKVLDDVGGFDENMKVSDDWELWLRIFKKYNFDFVDDFLVKYHFHKDNLSSRSSHKKANDIVYMIEKHKNLYKQHQKKHSELLRYTGNLYMLSGDTKMARGLLKKATNLNFNLKNMLTCLLSYAPSALYTLTVLLKRKLSFGSIKKS
jgi:glycosyltransferase involved in cell wall biosynthesis